MRAFRSKMHRMVHTTVFVAIFLNVIGHTCIHGVRLGRRKVEVIHKGRPLRDLVILDSRITPHDLDYLGAFVKPKLLEDSKAEGMMLQKNGIEDFRPLDLSIDTDEDRSNNQQYENGIDQTSDTDNSDNNGDYDLRNMPEYNMETKADFKGNQEAIDWMMKDPNDFSVKSYEDIGSLEGRDNFSQSKDSANMLEENNDEMEQDGNPSLHHHRNHGSKKHRGTSAGDTNGQLRNQDPDVRQSVLNKMAAKRNRHRHEKETRLKEKYHEDDGNDSEYSAYENVGHGKKSWDNAGEEPHDSIFDANDIGQSLRDTTLNDLNSRIKNQDARLFKELENFQNVDNFENDDDPDILGSFDEENDERGDLGDKSESAEYREDDSSSEEDNKLSNERKDNNNLEDINFGTESKSENDNSGYEDNTSDFKGIKDNDDHQDDGDDSGSEQGNKNYDNGTYEEDDDRGSKKEDDSQSDQIENENRNDDNETFKSKDRVSSEDSKGAANVEEDNETDDEGKEENTKVNEMGSEQRTSKDGDIESKSKHQPEYEDIHDANKSSRNQEEKTTNASKGSQASYKNETKDPSNQKLVQETTVDSKRKNEKNTSTESYLATKVQNGKHVNVEDDASGDGKLFQGTTHALKIDNEKQISMGNVINGGKITNVISNVEDGKYSFSTDDKLQNSNSNTYQASVRQPKHNRKNTADEPLLRAGTYHNGKQHVVHQKLKDNYLKMERIRQAKPRVAFTRPEIVGRIKGERHKEKVNNHNSNQNGPTTTGIRRNQPNYAPSTPVYSMSDLQKLQSIVSYLRGTEASRFSPTKSSSYLNPDSFSLKSLYYYPLHPTPQEDTDATQGTKDSTFSEWNDWSTCSVTCGKGTSVRARVCLVPTCSQKDLLETKHCYEGICADQVERESLEEHNKLRRKHFSPPLLWSHSLARKAQQIAQSLAGKDFLTLDDLQERRGESLAQIHYNNEHLAKRAIDKWYSEINTYSFSYPKISEKTRHFAQIVWKRTKEMGLAVAKSPTGDYAFAVALYSPAIDSKEHLQQNVLPPGVKNDLYSTFRRRSSTEKTL